MQDEFFLKRGERGLLVGQTGSGKSEGAIFHLQNAPVFPVIMYDTKIEDNLFKVSGGQDNLMVANNFESFFKIAKMPKVEQPDYILVRPEVNEVLDVGELDKYVQLGYDRFGASYHYFDEAYNWHNNGRCGAPLLGMLTRGRSKGKTTLLATQRPSWISRFCFTESQKFFVYRLGDLRDRKTIDSMIPEFSSLPLPPKYHFYHYEVGHHDKAKLYKPVPFSELVEEQIQSGKKWY